MTLVPTDNVCVMKTYCNLVVDDDDDPILAKRARFPSSGVLQAESLTVVDAGLDFNLAFPPVLRPERPTDVFLVFDYSWLGTQENDPFKVISMHLQHDMAEQNIFT